ncbi:Ail/Lom family outer membrane beta-barrel protein [Enterobacteriaceae bacterium LUAb1]
MKVLWMTSALVVAPGFSTLAQADQHTVSLGYAQSKVQNLHNIKGVNLKYRYEWDSPFSVMSSFTYMSGKDDYSYLLDRDIINNNVKIKYYSLSVGPAYRFNEFISAYGLLGVNRNKVDYSSQWYNYQGSHVLAGSWSGNENKTSLMYGAGVQINLLEDLAVDIGYEGSRLKVAGQSHNINGFNIAIGYRF